MSSSTPRSNAIKASFKMPPLSTSPLKRKLETIPPDPEPAAVIKKVYKVSLNSWVTSVRDDLEAFEDDSGKTIKFEDESENRRMMK